MSGQASRRRRHLFVAAFVLSSLALAGCEDPNGTAQTPIDVAEERASVPPPTVETVQEVRQVIPGGDLLAPPVGEEIVRLPTPPVPAPPPRPVSLGIVIVEEANRLQTRRGTVLLKGVALPSPNATCLLADGRTPLCRTLARTAVQRHIAQRSVSCVLAPRDDPTQPHDAPCSLGDGDLSTWVVRQGWGYAGSDAPEPLRAAQETARQSASGLWGLRVR